MNARCLGGVPILLNVLGSFRRGNFLILAYPPIMISLANLKNYLFDGAFHSSNLSIIHPSMYLSTDSFNKYLLSTHCVIDSWDTTMKQSAVVPSLMGLQLQELFLLLTYYSSLWRVIPLQL